MCQQLTETAKEGEEGALQTHVQSRSTSAKRRVIENIPPRNHDSNHD